MHENARHVDIFVESINEDDVERLRRSVRSACAYRKPSRVCRPQDNVAGYTEFFAYRRGSPFLFNVKRTKFVGINITSIKAIELTARSRLDPPQLKPAPHQAIGNAQALADVN